MSGGRTAGRGNRAPGLAALMLAVGAALLVSCGTSAPTVSSTGNPDPVLAAWAAFPADRVPRPLVLVGPSVVDPRTGFPDGPSKLAYLERAIDLPASLPEGPQTADGYPVTSGAAAAQAFMSTRAKGPPAGRRLSVSDVALGMASFQTDRGVVDLPAWQFWFGGVADSAAVLAVAPSRMFVASPVASGRAPRVTGASLAPDGRTLVIKFTGMAAGNGPCTADYTVDLASSRTAVAVDVHEHAHTSSSPTGSGGVACTLIGYPRQVTTRLDAPLGARVLVDDTTGHAVPVTPSS